MLPICRNSLRWIIRYRSKAFTTEKLCELDGHSGGSWTWTTTNSEWIDQFGWEKWLESEASQGYSHFLKQMFNSKSFSA